ncbi:MAG: YicC/YloC family endoribonuclease [Bacteroidota bacterium]
MLLSMTGYGRASQMYRNKKITVELRALNGKFSDLRFKVPQNYREKEAIIRRTVMDKVHRGKLDLLIEVTSQQGDDGYGLNKALFRKYHQELNQLAEELQIPKTDMLSSILRIPNVVAAAEGTIDEEEWKAVQQVMNAALAKFQQFRASEGEALKRDMRLHVETIMENLAAINPFDTERQDRLRKRLRQRFEDYKSNETVDENRFEQELIYYFEKMDLNEEKVRLAQHCKYFLEVLDKSHEIKGKKLNFISQEIGREINTMGAKAHSSDIQRLVVVMKDELEKIKEQSANIV